MDLSLKVRIDHIVGRALCYGLFPFVRLVGLLFRRDHSITHENVHCIAVSKYYGMGSIIHAMPMLRALKKQYPQARLIFVSRKSNRTLFTHFPDIDEVLCVDDSTFLLLLLSNIKLIYHLIQRKVDLFFDLELFSAYGALVSLFSLARNRLGFLCGLETDFKTHLYTHLMYFNLQMPIRICYLQLARIAGVAEDSSTDLVKPILTEQLRDIAQERLNAIIHKQNRHQRSLAININASDLLLERRWMPDRYEMVARYFAQQGYLILFVGSADERSYVQEVVNHLKDIPDHAYNVAGSFTLSEFFAFLENCDILLTADTGIMNFAYALNIPTVSLWGPCSPIQYHVEKETTVAIWKSVYCSPCVHRFYTPPCRGNNMCMYLIEVNEVIAAVETLLAHKKQKSGENPNPAHSDLSSIPLGVLRHHK